MPNRLIFLLLLCLIWLPPAGAATLRGELIDEQTGKPLDYADIEVKLLVPDGARGWTVAGTTRPFPSNRFAFRNLAPGRYAVEFIPIQPQSYQWEIYADAHSAAALTPIQLLTEQDEVSLGMIAIAPPPFQFAGLTISPHQEGRDFSAILTTAGGTVEVTGTLLNHTGEAQPLLLWVTAAEPVPAVFLPAGESTWGKIEIEGGERRIVAAAGETPFRLRFEVPPLPAANKEYYIFLFAGKNRWEALAQGSYLFLSATAPDAPAGTLPQPASESRP